MSYQDTQALKTNMFSVFLPTFLAIIFAVPMAAVMSYMLIHSERSLAENNQTANTSISASAPMCVAPVESESEESASASASVGHGHLVYGSMLPSLSTGSVTQNSYETNTTTTYYDSYNTGSYNKTWTTSMSNTQSWEDNDTNTQSW